MLVTVHYPSSIDAVLAGKRNPERISVWRRVEVDVNDYAGSVAPAAQVTVVGEAAYATWFDQAYEAGKDNLGRTVRRYHVTDGPGLYVEVGDGAAVDALANDRSAYYAVFGRTKLHESLKVFEHMPDIRRIVRDWGPDQDADIVRRAADCFVSGGRLFKPAREPFFHVEVSGNGKFAGFRLATWNEPDPNGQFRSFRLDCLDDALACAAGVGASPVQVERMRAKFSVRIDRPVQLLFHPARSHLVAAAKCMIDGHKEVLSQLPFEKLVIWGRLRDGYLRWQASLNPPLSRLASLTTEAYQAFQDEPHMPAGKKRDVAAAVAAVPFIPEMLEGDAQALDDFSAPAI